MRHPSVHDAFFRQVFGDHGVAVDELRAVLPPALVRAVDWSTVRVERASFVDEELRQRHGDLVLSCRIGRREARIYFVVEHQSRADPWMPFRVLVYVVRMLEAWRRQHPRARRLPLVIPVVVHHGRRLWRGPTAVEDLFDAEPEVIAALGGLVPRLSFAIDDLAATDEATLRARRVGPLAKAAMLALRDASRRRGDRQIARVGDLLDAAMGRGEVEAAAAIMRYALLVGRGRRVRRREVEMLTPRVREVTMTLGESLMAQGRVEGRRALVKKLLRLRFGTIPKETVARLDQATAAQLDRCAARILRAKSVDGVLRGVGGSAR